MAEVPDGAELAARVEALVAETARLRGELERMQQELAHLREARQALPRRARGGVERHFLTLAAAATALGLGRERLRALIRIGALRTVSFPNGRVRVPRSELARIEELGLEDAPGLRPVTATVAAGAAAERAAADAPAAAGEEQRLAAASAGRR